VTPEQHARLVACLQAVAKRPALYIGDHDPSHLELWLSGFAAAVDIEWLKDERRQLREEIWKSHGWKVTATSSWRQMVEKKMSSTEIIAEMIAIEIEVLNRISSANAREH
jgi:hypothetical protein